jgi:hypothetical protein
MYGQTLFCVEGEKRKSCFYSQDLQPPLRGPRSHRPLSGGRYRSTVGPFRGRSAVRSRGLTFGSSTPAPRSHQPLSRGHYTPPRTALSGKVSFSFPSDLQPRSAVLSQNPRSAVRSLIEEVAVISPMILSGTASRFTLFSSGSPDLQALSPKPEPYFLIEEVAVISPLILSGRVSFTLFSSGYPDLRIFNP